MGRITNPPGGLQAKGDLHAIADTGSGGHDVNLGLDIDGVAHACVKEQCGALEGDSGGVALQLFHWLTVEAVSQEIAGDRLLGLGGS